MKEAAGEANMTVITIVLIGIVAAVGAILIPKILNNASNSACCQSNGGTWFNNSCYVSSSCTISNGEPSSCTTVMATQPICN